MEFNQLVKTLTEKLKESEALAKQLLVFSKEKEMTLNRFMLESIEYRVSKCVKTIRSIGV